MAKFEAVDRLMEQASQPARKGTAESVLQAQVSAAEPAVPGTASRTAPGTAARPSAAELGAPPQPSGSERAAQWLGALRPLLPAVSGALKMVDHGAVQAVARLLPLVGTAASGIRAAAPTPAAPNADLLASAERDRKALAARVDGQTAQLAQLEDQVRRNRESLARLASEQQSGENALHEITDKLRLLSAAVTILILLVLAEGVLLFLFHHR